MTRHRRCLMGCVLLGYGLPTRPPRRAPGGSPGDRRRPPREGSSRLRRVAASPPRQVDLTHPAAPRTPVILRGARRAPGWFPAADNEVENGFHRRNPTGRVAARPRQGWSRAGGQVPVSVRAVCSPILPRNEARRKRGRGNPAPEARPGRCPEGMQGRGGSHRRPTPPGNVCRRLPRLAAVSETRTGVPLGVRDPRTTRHCWYSETGKMG
jgi:hypothetical protein